MRVLYFLLGVIVSLFLVVVSTHITLNITFLCGALWGVFFTAIFVIAWECMVINLIMRDW